MTSEKLKVGEIKAKKEKLQIIHLKGGAEVLADWNSRTKCKACNKEIFFAKTKKGKMMPIELVSLGEWESHFATCPAANSFRKPIEKIPEEGEKKYGCGHAPNAEIFNTSTIATSAYFTWKEQTDGGDNSKCFDCFCAGNKKRRR